MGFSSCAGHVILVPVHRSNLCSQKGKLRVLTSGLLLMIQFSSFTKEITSFKRGKKK